MDKDLEEKLDTIVNNQADLKGDVTAITTMLVGNPRLKQKGLVDEVESNSKVRKNVYKAGGGFVSLVAIWEAIKEFLS